DERSLIADTTGAVLVNLGSRQVTQVKGCAGTDHGTSQMAGLLGAHATQVNRHEEGGGLVLGPRALRHSLDKRLDLLPRQGQAVSFFAADIHRTHRGTCGAAMGSVSIQCSRAMKFASNFPGEPAASC